jgi:lysophospholipase L1-like esterase
VKGEARRLYIDELALPAGGSRKLIFNVHVRTKMIAGTSDVVKLKPREVGAADWDEKLTLEFSGTPSVRSISVGPTSVPVVYLAGDSTVVDQDKEPWAAWGQMLPAFFTDKASIANEAESGETIYSFVGEKRLEKIESTWKKGDFLLIQFAHNDQKLGAGYVPAQTEYKDLLRRYIRDAHAAGVTPVLVTSMNRRAFDDEGHIKQTLGEYPQAMRDVASEQHVALLDLNAISKTLFEAIGPQGTLHAFVHFPANTFPDQPDELKDDTHFTSWGAYLLAQAVVQSIRDQRLLLDRYLKTDLPAFDPNRPMRFEDLRLPVDPAFSASTPYGDSGKVAKQ